MALFLGLSSACVLSETTRRLWSVRIIPAVLVISQISASLTLTLASEELSEVKMA